VAGTPVTHPDELFAQLTGEIVGQSTSVEILRGGQLQTLEVVLGER
jgi:S1-C subfamily serine protease